MSVFSMLAAESWTDALVDGVGVGVTWDEQGRLGRGVRRVGNLLVLMERLVIVGGIGGIVGGLWVLGVVGFGWMVWRGR